MVYNPSSGVYEGGGPGAQPVYNPSSGQYEVAK